MEKQKLIMIKHIMVEVWLYYSCGWSYIDVTIQSLHCFDKHVFSFLIMSREDTLTSTIFTGKKMKRILFLFLLIITSNSYAIALKTECNQRNLTFKPNVKIIQYVVSTIHQGDLSYGFSVQLTEGANWYHVVLKNSNEDSTYRGELASTARIAQILGLSVNACVNSNGNYLAGLQLAK